MRLWKITPSGQCDRSYTKCINVYVLFLCTSSPWLNPSPPSSSPHLGRWSEVREQPCVASAVHGGDGVQVSWFGSWWTLVDFGHPTDGSGAERGPTRHGGGWQTTHPSICKRGVALETHTCTTHAQQSYIQLPQWFSHSQCTSTEWWWPLLEEGEVN